MKSLLVAGIGGVAFAGLQHALGLTLWPALAIFALGVFVQAVQGWVQR